MTIAIIQKIRFLAAATAVFLLLGSILPMSNALVSPPAQAADTPCALGYHRANNRCVKSDDNNPSNNQNGANCDPGQTPTKIDSGKNKGKWYCKGDPTSVAGTGGPSNGKFQTGDNQNKTIRDVCGGQGEAVGVAIKIGCKGQGNPIADALFAIIRILSNLVGFVIIASIIYGGIQYIGSRGDPQSTALAVNRIRSSLFALLIFIFGYAILNYLIPAGFLG